MRKEHFLIIVLLASGLLPLRASAQTLPPVSRTVFKCEVEGKVTYSDAPCLGAQRIEVEPTRGLNKSTGREQVGQDVQRERAREAFADGVKPVTGMDAQQLKKAGQRAQLMPDARRECQGLDRELPAAERDESALLRQPRSEARDRGLKQLQSGLLKLRLRARELGC